MVRSLTLGIVAFGTVVSLAAQAPAPPTPAASPQQPAVDQPAPRTPAPSAQQPSADQPSPRAQAPAQQSAAASTSKTYSGCLKPGTTPGAWVLESAALGSGTAAPSDRAVGTSGASKETFSLIVKPSDNLKPHANHKIEVTGVVGPALATSPSPDAAASAAAAPKQAISIESFKMVSASCQ